MSLAWTAAAIGAYTAYTTNEARRDQKHAQRASIQQAEAAAAAQDRAINKANAKRPDVSSLMAANMLASQQGQGGTMLTGGGGARPTLGAKSLLGGG